MLAFRARQLAILTLLIFATPCVTDGADVAVQATPAAAGTCGNGHLDAGETCSACAADCSVHACTAAAKPHLFDVTFDPPAQMRVSSITVLVGYDSRRVSFPGSAGAESVAKRLSDKQATAIVVTNDLDYALRAVFTRPGGIDGGRLFTVAVDACRDAPAPTAGDFGCTIEGCAAASGQVAGCGCRVTAH